MGTDINKGPLVSVLVNSYNRPRLIADTLNSILRQTWQNIEIIVADDYSDDQTSNILRRYVEQYHVAVARPGKVPSTRERRMGARCAIGINAGIAIARGDFFCFVPDDDFLTPISIEARATYLVEHPDVNCVYGRLEACKRQFPREGIHHAPLETLEIQDQWTFAANDGPPCVHDRNGFWSATPIARAANKIDHGMMMIRRVPQLPRWPERPTPELDCDDALFFDAVEHAGLGPFHSVPDVVLIKRYHAFGHRTDPAVRE